MLSVARRPRNLALLGLATLFAAIFVALGFWQMGAAQNHAREDALRRGPQQPVVALDTLLKPHEPFPNDGSLRRVTFSGQYEPGKQFVVPNRVLEGQRGYWVLTPVVVDGTGARMTVLRGFVTDPKQAPAPTSGKVELMGYLAPSESSSLEQLPAGQHGSVDLPSLVNEWGGDLYNAFVFTGSQTPAAQLGQMKEIPPPRPDSGGLDARNLGYALQWWVFAFFAYYLWWRTVREDWRDEQAALAGPAGPEPDATDHDRNSNEQKDVHV